MLQRKRVHVQEVKPSLYAIALVRQTCEVLKRLVICLNFEGDAVEHLSVTLDRPHDRGAFQLRNVPLALIVEGGSAERGSVGAEWNRRVVAVLSPHRVGPRLHP